MSIETGLLVQKLRIQRGWSQEQLSAVSALSVRTIQRIERGQPASPESLKALASVFEIDFSTLREPDMNTPDITKPDINLPGSNLPGSAPVLNNDEALALAHVRRVKGFYMHVAQYAVIVGFIAILNQLTHPRFQWWLFVALGWGSGIVLQGLKVFDKVPFLTADWERREVEKHLGRKL